ncbi:class I SAM-dependent methyltransferase [Breznakiella homolactica]|uniref:Class I SAM-dependent methyltransferase n=1 Tax=Breznakiella homolactica TaxID=2798577 RepID=A0A7T8B960_9SPIR|nr:class I SAM-dependent methyltransferase [Breznakiella homolactica]QQO07610.1 class I SAM-dependent methyltransferase [Breznakiella homolactica]
MTDNTAKFNGMAENYAKYRPTYSKEFIDYLYNEIGFNRDSIVADIGAGTGIFSKLLLERGNTVICVEPNSDMLTAAREFLSEYKNCQFINAPAEQTGIPDKSVDFITAAQAFHWFDEDRFKAECRRILKDTGKAVLVWNCRVLDAEPVAAGDEINRKYCPDFNSSSGGDRGIVSDNHAGFFKDGLVDIKTFPNDYLLDEDGLIGRNLSSSYAPKRGEPNYESYISELKKLFSKYSVNGIFTMPNIIQSYVGNV